LHPSLLFPDSLLLEVCVAGLRPLLLLLLLVLVFFCSKQRGCQIRECGYRLHIVAAEECLQPLLVEVLAPRFTLEVVVLYRLLYIPIEYGSMALTV
jgi:hypothetical protein